MTIEASSPRKDIQAQFVEDGRAFNGPLGSTVEDFMLAAKPATNGRIVASLVNGQLRELSHVLDHDVKLEPITMAHSDGVRIYRRSLCFLMIVAAAEIFPDDIITIKHSMPFGGYYCERENNRPFTTGQLTRLQNRMQELVDNDLPINRVVVALNDALQLFRKWGDLEKADLFSRRRKDYLTLYELNGIQDYFHGFMVPSSGYLDLFNLSRYQKGFILQFPRRHEPYRLQTFEDEPRLAAVFQDYDDWLSVIGVPTVASLNNAIRAGRTQEVILIAEALHNRQLAATALDISNHRPDIKIVLISGPTSAGKTTFSKRLAVQLLALGIRPVAIAMDNYFVDRDKTPLDEKGNYNFEALEAVDVPLFRHHLQLLLNGETIQLPAYNFHTGQRETGEALSIGSDQVILIEGIHGLNPKLVEGISPKSMYRVFISAFTQLNLDKHNRVPTTDTRLLRRIVRDAAHRGYTAADTIKRWQSVRLGEKNYIFPHQNNANVFFNSALAYELSVLKPLAQPLLLQVEPGTEERIEANRLLAFLQWFDPMNTDGIPNDSILREFIGGSILENFEPWTN